MRRRLLGAAALALVLFLTGDVAVTLLVLPGYWRPLPPFGAVTNPRQTAWLERQRRELDGAAPEGLGRFDARLGWVPRAGAASPDGRTHTNSRGWRGAREAGPLPPQDRRRVVTFGDSFTFCEEVGDEETWQARLESSWSELEVLNLGVGGYGTDQAFLRAQIELESMAADVVLVGLLLENVGRNVNRYRPRWYPNADSPAAKPRFVLQRDRLELVPLPFADRRALVDAIADGSVLGRLEAHEHWADDHLPAPLRWSGLARLFAGRRVYAERSLPLLWSEVEGEPFRVTLALLEAFGELARDYGVEHYGVLVFPTRDDLRGVVERDARYWTTLTEELSARGIAHLDLARPLAAAWREAGGGDALFGTSHLSAAGNARVAAALEGWLRELVEAPR